MADFTDPADETTWTTLTRAADVNGRVSTSVFDLTTLTWSTTSHGERTTTTTVDARNRVTRREVAGFHPVSYVYDSDGRIEQITHAAGILDATGLHVVPE